MKPLVSIIIPVYNVEKYIERCCRQVFSQTYQNIEVVIVNDGTPDRSIEIVEGLLDGEFANMKPRVKIINQENKGLPEARRTGLRHATGDYVIQFDSDDWPSRKIVGKMVAAAVREDADIVICNYYNVYKFWNIPRREKRMTDKMQLLDTMFSHKHFRAFVWNKLVRRSLYDEGFLVPRRFMCEDVVITAQFILKASKIHFIGDHLYYYRKTRMSDLSSEVLDRRFRDVFVNETDLWEFFEKKGDNPLAPIRDSYMLQLAWLAFHRNITDLLEDHPYILECVRGLPVDSKYSLEVENQERLKEMIRNYDSGKKS